ASTRRVSPRAWMRSRPGRCWRGRRGGSAFTRVTRAASFPLGTIFDARHGSVRIYSQLQTGEVQAADFFGGQFLVLQSSGAGGLTEIKLVGGNFASCRVRSAAAIGRSVRHL